MAASGEIRSREELSAQYEYFYLDSIAEEVWSSADMHKFSHFTITPAPKNAGTLTALADYAKYFGPASPSHPCDQCKIRGCQGHWGLLDFPMDKLSPGKRVCIYHPSAFTTLRLLLKCVCGLCWRLRINPEDSKYREKIARIRQLPVEARLQAVLGLMGKKDSKECLRCLRKGGINLVCPQKEELLDDGSDKFETTVCYTPLDAQPKSRKKKGQEEETVFKVESETVRLRPLNVREGLGRLTEDEREILGFSANEIDAHFLDCLLVSPEWSRPDTVTDRSDELTNNYNQAISDCATYLYGGLESNELEVALTKVVVNIIRNFKDIAKRKKGLIRNKNFARRTNQAARMTIIPPRTYHLNFFQVGIPSNVASELSRKQLVTSSNIDRLQQLMFSGRIKLTTPVRGNRPWVPVQVTTNNFTDRSNHFLEEGDEVSVMMSTGDVGVTGRQPTHNMHNIMGAIALVINAQDVMELNTNLTPELGADFDGDQMYFFLLQIAEAIEEGRTIMRPDQRLRTAKSGTPAIALAYNNPLSVTLLTIDPNLEIGKDLFLRCIERALIDYNTATGEVEDVFPQLEDLFTRLDKYGVPRYSGRALFSYCLPREFAYKNKGVLILEGVLIEGRLTGEDVGRAPGAIMDRMTIQFQENPVVLAQYINRASNVLAVFLDACSFTINYSDYDVSRRPRRRIYSEEVVSAVDRVETQVLDLNPRDVDYRDQLEDAMVVLLSLSDKLKSKVPDVLKKVLEIPLPKVDSWLSRIDRQNAIRLAFEDLRGDALPPWRVEIAQKMREAELKLMQLAGAQANTIPIGSDNITDAGYPRSGDIAGYPRSGDIAGYPRSGDIAGYGYYDKLYYEAEREKILADLQTIPINADFTARDMVENNVLFLSAKSMAKGTLAHFGQMSVNLGMQSVGGSILPRTVSENSRVTVHNIPGYITPETLGFVAESYMDQMSPFSSIATSMSNREQTTATNAPTRVTGRLQKDMQHSLANVITYSGGVFSSDAILLDPCAGGDSKDGEKVLLVGGRLQSASISDMIHLLNAQSE